MKINTSADYCKYNIKGIYIDEDELLKREKYSWFAKLPESELNNTNNIAAKFMLIALNK